MPRATKPKAPALPALAACEAALKEPAAAWVARCYEIASKIVDAGLVKGAAVYGHWTGSVNRRSRFYGKPIVQHGWIALDAAVYDMNPGAVLDPTRWVFEAASPYIYVGEPVTGWDVGTACVNCDLVEDEHRDADFDHCGDFTRPPWPYDEGGNRLRQARQTAPPRFDPTAPTFTLKLPRAIAAHVAMILDHPLPAVTRPQLFWLANLPYDRLAPFAWEIYRAINKHTAGLIPIDNERRAARDHKGA
jgi:hypothetical protein